MLSPNQKAKQLIEKFSPLADYTECDIFTERQNMFKNAKSIALIHINEQLMALGNLKDTKGNIELHNYYTDVENELQHISSI